MIYIEVDVKEEEALEKYRKLVQKIYGLNVRKEEIKAIEKYGGK